MNALRTHLGLLVWFAFAAGNSPASGQTLVPIGLQKQLVVDDYAIESTSGLSRQLGQVHKENNGQPIMENASVGCPHRPVDGLQVAGRGL